MILQLLVPLVLVLTLIGGGMYAVSRHDAAVAERAQAEIRAAQALQVAQEAQEARTKAEGRAKRAEALLAAQKARAEAAEKAARAQTASFEAARKEDPHVADWSSTPIPARLLSGAGGVRQ